MASIEDKVVDIVVDKLGVDRAEVTRDAVFVDDLGADSLDLVELIMAMEEEFGFEIADGKDRGFRAHVSFLGGTLTNPTRLRNRRAACRSSISQWEFLLRPNFLAMSQ